MRAPGPRVQVGLALVLLLLGFLASSAFVQERLRERELPERRKALEQLVAERRESIDALLAQTRRIEEKLRRVEARVGSGSAELGALLREVNGLRVAAGMGALRGPGVVVTLEDSDRAPASRSEASDLRIQDLDLRSVVNTLWRAGAEAVSINGRRVVSTTAIRAAGGSILVNYGAVTSPYRIVALGQPETMRRMMAGSEVGRRFQVWTQVYGLGFDVATAPAIRVPALRGGVAVRYASPES